MKVELKLTAAQILFLSTVLNTFVKDNKKTIMAKTSQEKAVYSISVDVANKLHTKERAFANSFDETSSKLYKMSFKYFEAHCINYFVRKLKDSPATDDNAIYFNSVAHNIYSQLDPKL